MPEGRLDSWKEIADYLGKGVSTVRRWEREEGLPVRRLEHTKRGSVVAFHAELDAWLNSRTTPLPEATQPEKKDSIFWLWTPVFALALTGLLLIAGRGDRPDWGEPRLIPVTSDDVMQDAPGLSPDGRFAAYEVRDTGQRGIVIHEIQTRSKRHLTRTPGADVFPRWSPDGRRIVFTRIVGDSREIMLVASEGGDPKPVRRIADSTVPSFRHEWASWLPDGKSLLVIDRDDPNSPLAVYLHNLETGKSRRITTPNAKTHGDTVAAASPDGERLAFIRHINGNGSDLFVCEFMNCQPKRLTFELTEHVGFAWTPDGRTIVYSTGGVDTVTTLRRIGADGATSAARVEGVVPNAVWPSIPPALPMRIAYQNTGQSIEIVRWGGNASAVEKRIAPSGRTDANPQVSPDGSRLAFVSTRDGFREVWTSRADTADPRKLTVLQKPYTDSPRWSPDGKTLAFSTSEGDNRDIYTVPASGGTPHRMTTAPSEEGRPNWSADGKWIYFRSDSSGAKNIWRIPSAGGAPEQVTTGGGFEALASADGLWLYFTKERKNLGLWRLRSESKGPGEQVSKHIREG